MATPEKRGYYRREQRAASGANSHFQEAAIAAVPVHYRTPSGETGHPIRFPCNCDIPQAALSS